jgi:subtilisin family serine protease/subtilisin-like proprotein convertase family protein
MKTNAFKLSALAVLVASGVAACGGSGNARPVAEDVSFGDQRQWVGVQGTLNASDANGDDLTFSFMEDGSAVSQNSEGYYEFSHGLLDFDASSQTFTYVPLTANDGVSFEYEVSDGELSDTGTVTLGAVTGDPLAAQQWHLNNTGQTAFAMQDSYYAARRDLYLGQGFTEEEIDEMGLVTRADWILVPGEDLNVVGAYKHGVTGKGTISVVVDSGMAINHPDLVDNVLSHRSLNFDPNATDRTDTTSPGDGGDHGTSVAGLIAAEGWNGQGGRGVAPEAGLIGMNYLSFQGARNEMMAHGMAGSGISPSDPVAAFNRSYGISFAGFVSGDDIGREITRFPTENLRNGLGALNIKSSGNSFLSDDFGLCEAQEGLGLVSCFDGNMDPNNSSFFTLSIAAVNSDGRHTSYSTAGSNVWVAGTAGEYGTAAPAMVTTDQTTCTRGYSGWPAYDNFNNVNGDFLASIGVEDYHQRVYPFNNPMGDLNAEFNASCNYTSTFNGTSSAAPNVSGVVNLIVDANPDLSWREVRYILAATATQVGVEDAPVTFEVGGGEFTAHHGWVENAAGYSFNNKYGFGRPNAGAAVEMAMAGSVELPDLIETDWMDVTFEEALVIPDNDAEGLTLTMDVEDELTIEGMQARFAVRNPQLSAMYPGVWPSTAASDLAIEVTSPAGTTSVMLTSRNAIYAGAPGSTMSEYVLNMDAHLLTNAFLGESSVGTWTIRLLDTNGEERGQFFNNSDIETTVEAAGVRFYGH